MSARQLSIKVEEACKLWNEAKQDHFQNLDAIPSLDFSRTLFLLGDIASTVESEVKRGRASATFR